MRDVAAGGRHEGLCGYPERRTGLGDRLGQSMPCLKMLEIPSWDESGV